jgi:hypothetical protein
MKSQAQKEMETLAKLIYGSNTVVRPDYVVGFYRYWAKTDAIENVLVKKGLITKGEISKEVVPILKAMQKDFRQRK